MKKLVLIFLFMAEFVSAFGQGTAKHVLNDSLLVKMDSLVRANNAWLEQIELDLSLKERYKLYQTENIYTLLELDTKTEV